MVSIVSSPPGKSLVQAILWPNTVASLSRVLDVYTLKKRCAKGTHLLCPENNTPLGVLE